MLKRPDTPLANTIDPGIKKIVTTNPNTGVTTYKHTWNSDSSSGVKKTVAKSNGIKPTTKKSSTSGTREFSTFSKPKNVGVKKQEISAAEMKPEKKFVPTTQKEKVIERKITDYNKNKQSNESFDEYRKRIQERANKNSAKAKSSSGGRTEFSKKFGSRSSSCRNC